MKVRTIKNLRLDRLFIVNVYAFPDPKTLCCVNKDGRRLDILKSRLDETYDEERELDDPEISEAQRSAFLLIKEKEQYRTIPDELLNRMKKEPVFAEFVGWEERKPRRPEK